MLDHIDDLIAISVQAANDVAKGRLGVKKAGVVHLNMHDAQQGIVTSFRAQQDKYKVHNVPWTRKRPAEKIEGASDARSANLVKARAKKRS